MKALASLIIKFYLPFVVRSEYSETTIHVIAASDFRASLRHHLHLATLHSGLETPLATLESKLCLATLGSVQGKAELGTAALKSEFSLATVLSEVSLLLSLLFGVDLATPESEVTSFEKPTQEML